MSSVTCLHTPTKKPKIVNVVLLDGSEYPVYVDVRSKFQEVFNQVASHLSLRETEYFGLALKKDDEYQFLVLDEKIHKQAPKRWKTGEGEGFDCQGQVLLTVWFRVQFYVDQTVLLREKITRHLYYIQLQENFLQYEHCYSVEKCFQLVGYTLQADFGNFIPEKHIDGYFDPRKYFPAWIIKEKGLEFITRNAPVMHKDLHNMTRNVAELKFIREVSGPPSEHNLHFYKVKRKKTDKVANMWLAICAKGVQVYENLKNHYWRNLIATFPWPDIGKLYFDKNKFEIRFVGRHKGRKFAYYTDCDEKSKYLLYFCRTTHMFQMAIQPKLMEIRHLDAEDQRRYRESYIYSDANDLVANGVVSQYRAKVCPKKSKNNRFSVISNGSSATSSGIVSDKMPSFDESEEHKEIMIDSPPYSLMGTPAQSRSKFCHPSNLHNFKQPALNPVTRSPGLAPHSLELYKPLTKRSASAHSPTLCSAGSTLGDKSPVRSSGGYHTQLQQQPQTPVLYTDRAPAYHSPSSPGEKEKLTGLTGHSPCHKDSFNNGKALLQKHLDSSPHEYENTEKVAGAKEHLPQQHVPVRKVNSPNESAYASIQASLNMSYTAPSPFLQPVSSSGVTTLSDNLPATSVGSALSPVMLPDVEMQLQNAQEVYVPQSAFTEVASVSEIPEDPVYSMQSIMVPNETVFNSEVCGAAAASCEASGGLILLKENSSEVAAKPKLSTNLDVDSVKPKKTKPSAGGKSRQGLHPELEEIRDQSHAHSLPLITALCNDLSLMHSNSTGSGSCGGNDASTIRSIDSHHSDDSRRWSINHLPETDTMITFQTSRPYSWNCPEQFNIDSSLPLSRGSQYKFQKIFECSSLNPTSSWTSACNMPHSGSLDRYMYFPELIAQ